MSDHFVVQCNYSLLISIFNNPQIQYFPIFPNTPPNFSALKTFEKSSKNYWTKDSKLIESFFEWMKSWLDILKKGSGNKRKTMLFARDSHLKRCSPWSIDFTKHVLKKMKATIKLVCVVTHIWPSQMREVWTRNLNFLPLPFRTPTKQAMHVGVRKLPSASYPFLCYPGPLRYVLVWVRLSGYFMWHTWRTFLRKPDDGDGVGLIAVWRTLKSKRKSELGAVAG